MTQRIGLHEVGSDPEIPSVSPANAAANQQLVETFVTDPTIKAVLPYYSGLLTAPKVERLVTYDGRETTLHVVTKGDIAQRSSFENQESVLRIGTLWAGELLFQGADVPPAVQLGETLNQRGSTTTDTPSDDELTVEALQQRCSCEGRPVVLPRLGETYQFDVCPRCFSVKRRLWNGKRLPQSTLVNADWLFNDPQHAHPINIDSDTRYLIRPPSFSPQITEYTRVHATLLDLSYTACMSETESRFGFYEPELFAGVLGVIDDTVYGYVLWTPATDWWYPRPVLRQVFIREPFRGQGLAQKLLTDWYHEFFDGQQYFAEQPNDGGEAVLRAAGHLRESETGIATPIVTLETNEIIRRNEASLKQQLSWFTGE